MEAKSSLPIRMLWLFIGCAILCFAGYLGARQGLVWYASLIMVKGGIPAWSFGPASVILASLAAIVLANSKSVIAAGLLLLAMVAQDAAQWLLMAGHRLVPSAIAYGVAAGLLIAVCVLLAIRRRPGVAFVAALVLAAWCIFSAQAVARLNVANGNISSSTVIDLDQLGQ